MRVPLRHPTHPPEVSLPQAAHRLGVSYEVAKRRLFKGELAGGQDRFGRWFVTVESIQRVLATESELSA